MADAVERLTAAVLAALAREDPTASSLRFLIRRYAATGRDDVRDALEPGLTRSLDVWPNAPREEYPGWLMLFGEAAAVSDDERLHEAARILAAPLQASFGHERRIAIAAPGVDACLRVDATVLPAGGVQRAIDELERLVASAYEPGEGLSAGATGKEAGRPRLADHVAAASALLTAFERTDRLPYSMLAEELMQFAVRTLGDAAAPGFVDGDSGDKPFTLNCEAASVLCRLAALHASDEYQRAAVVAPGVDYGRDAGRILQWLAPAAPDLGLAGAAFGLAAADWNPEL